MVRAKLMEHNRWPVTRPDTHGPVDLWQWGSEPSTMARELASACAEFCSSDDCWDQCDQCWRASKTLGRMLYERVQDEGENWITRAWLQKDIFTERRRVKAVKVLAGSRRRPVEAGDGGWSLSSSSASKPPAPGPPQNEPAPVVPGWRAAVC